MTHTSTGFTLHSFHTATTEGASILEKTEKKFGFIPNFMAAAVESPALIEAYNGLMHAFEESFFTATERQVVYLTVSVENSCHFCVPAHTSAIQKDESIDDSIATNLRTNTPLDDAKLQALSDFTREAVMQKGHVNQEELEKFLTAGYTRQHALEVMIGIAAKTLSNYTNALADTPLNDELKPNEWTETEFYEGAA